MGREYFQIVIRLYGAYGIPTYSIFDNDPEDDEAGNKKRKEIIETCGYL